jgi:hypothetical protein
MPTAAFPRIDNRCAFQLLPEPAVFLPGRRGREHDVPANGFYGYFYVDNSLGID